MANERLIHIVIRPNCYHASSDLCQPRIEDFYHGTSKSVSRTRIVKTTVGIWKVYCFSDQYILFQISFVAELIEIYESIRSRVATKKSNALYSNTVNSEHWPY
jgi:hypothetical protein